MNAYISTALAATEFDVLHRPSANGPVFDVRGNPTDAVGPAVHLSLSREEAEALWDKLGAALIRAEQARVAPTPCPHCGCVWEGHAPKCPLGSGRPHHGDGELHVSRVAVNSNEGE